MTIMDCEVTPNSKSNLWRAGKFSHKHLLSGIRGNLSKTAITMFMSEVLFRVIREESRDDNLFDWCEKSVLTLDALQSDFSNYPIIFLLGLSETLGFRPTEEGLSTYAGEQYRLVCDFLKSPAAEALLIPMTGAARTSLCESILRYLEHHTEARIDIRSLSVLHEVFAR